MTQEEKQLLLKDLYARTPYGVKVWYPNGNGVISIVKGIVNDICYFNENPRYGNCCPIESVKPYLRPMSSMTEEEAIKYVTLTHYNVDDDGKPYRELTVEAIDWLNTIHVDYRGLIEKGLAIEATQENNPYK